MCIAKYAYNSTAGTNMGDLNKAEAHSVWLHVQKCTSVLIKGTEILF